MATHWWREAKEHERLERQVRLLELLADRKQARIEQLERRLEHQARGLVHRTAR